MSWVLPAVFAICTLALVAGVFLLVRLAEKRGEAQAHWDHNLKEREDLEHELARREQAAREIVRERTDDDVTKRLRDGTF
jgi:redox-regulated HSP33 family molecular chaperone